MSTINHIGLSSGKDSTALWEWAIHESGYAIETIRGSFCDTENEYQEVYDQIKVLDQEGKKFGVCPIRTLHSEGFLALAIRKGRFPSARARFCTQVLKMFPTLYYIQELQLEGYDVVSHSGVRRDESTERSMMEEWSQDGFLKCRVRRPLLDWKIDDVWEIHKRHGIPINPLYFSGRKRVGCRLCCMSSKEDVRITAVTRPWVIDMYREWEKIVGKRKQTTALSLPGRTSEHGSGFFRATTVPPQYRSIKGLIRRRDGKNGKKGEAYNACTIDDVVRWSLTLRGGKQEGFTFMYEQDDSHLPCQSGYCE